ncbi:DUF3300 domain-containing protein [Tabrizicola sp. J26]|uniref:DUF3300 domain-containing protein n=1 Tax=Alitabrizicola rongguiensis TaxID=2909234 RepID=UPI001F4632C8|nr:DUF3300 domain-containing protein [Tabrizicola rongguiensis]MCF1710635.1 DUF3300 domain-containing protein [Tabrizicola rongguiensis]
MRHDHFAAVLAVLLAAWQPGGAVAETAGSTTETSTDASLNEAAAGEDLLSAEELDTLTAPVALFPDSLLTQIMMASTYPIDIVKADRFLNDNPDIADKERAADAEKQSWDPSVRALTAGFPDIVSRMADNIDWTEQMGEAVLIQTDDVLDSVQRLREQAKANGYLESNDAQTVEVTNDNTIVVQPADPEVVYVPTYDSNVVYTQTAPANPVYISDGNDWGDALATGAIVFGTAMILDEIFDDDDPWDDYWRGPPVIDWNDGDFYPRPGGINVNGDINIDNDRFTNISRDKVQIDRETINGGNRIGDLDRNQLDRQFDGSFQPGDDQRANARAKIENRKATGEGVARVRNPEGGGLAAGAGAGAVAGAAAGKIKKPDNALPKVNRPAATKQPAKVNKPANVSRPANVSKPTKAVRPATVNKPSRSSAMERTGGSRAKAASSRGRASAGRRG